MRTSLLAPDGVWTDVTEHLACWGEDVKTYPWQIITSDISDCGIGIRAVVTYSRQTLYTADDPGDRVIRNLVWSAVCAEGVSAVTLLHLWYFAGADAWLDAVTKWAGTTGDAPQYLWAERRCQWMLWAHYPTAAPDLENARLVVGNK